MKKNILLAIFDGVLTGLVFYISSLFAVSVYAQNISIEYDIILNAVCAILCSAVFVFVVINEKSNKKIAVTALVSILCFLLSVAVIFIICLEIPHRILPVYEDNNGYGIMLLFSAGTFIFVSIVIRAITLITILVRNAEKNNLKRRTN